MKHKKTIKILLLVIGALILLYLITIPWRSYTYRNEMKKGDDALASRQYTLALVHYQKAKILQPGDKSAENRAALAQSAAGDILIMRDFLKDRNQPVSAEAPVSAGPIPDGRAEVGTDLLALINSADSKTCNLETDRALIEKGLSQVAKINLEFCTNDGPKNYDSWLFLGIANQKLAEDNYIFKELKPDYRQQAADAYERAYAVDPINKTAIQYAIAINKAIGNQSEVDRWQKLLDSLNKISQ